MEVWKGCKPFHCNASAPFKGASEGCGRADGSLLQGFSPRVTSAVAGGHLRILCGHCICLCWRNPKLFMLVFVFMFVSMLEMKLGVLNESNLA